MLADKVPPAKLEELLIRISEIIECEIYRELGGSVDAVDVRLEASGDWPYTVEVHVNVLTKIPFRDLERRVNRALDSAFVRARELLKSHGLEEIL